MTRYAAVPCPWTPVSDPSPAKLSIRQGNGSVEIPGVKMDEVTCAGDVETIMVKANRAKSVACTAMNAQSSRSHCIFTLHIHGACPGDLGDGWLPPM